MAYAYIVEDEITCPICYQILDDPIECILCNTNYCRQCINNVKESNKKKNIQNICPLCKGELILNENKVFRTILQQKIQDICKKCRKPFPDKNELNEHIKKCKLFKCRICHVKYYTDEFITHIMDNHKENILKFSNKNFKGDPFAKEINNSTIYNQKKIEFSTIIDPNNNIFQTDINKKIEYNEYNIANNNKSNSNSNSNNNTNNNSNENSNNSNSIGNSGFESNNFPIGKDYMQVNYVEGEYINYFRPNNEIPYPNEQIKVPADKNLSNNKLYYCGKKTNLNCECCPDGRCKEKNCLCQSCMKFNKEVKYLKDYYLINKYARAAKFKYTSFRCLGQYFKINEVNGIKTKQKIKCNFPNDPCPGCKALNQLYTQYLTPEIYNNFN